MRDNTKNKVVKGLFWTYFENISAQVVTFVVTIILARLLLPSDYGAIALVLVFVNIANVFVNSSFSYALIQKKDVIKLDYDTIFWFNLAISILLYVILFISAPHIAVYYDFPILSPVLRVLSLKIIVSAYNSVQLAEVSHNLDFKRSFIATSGGAIISAAIGIFLAYHNYGVWALAIQNLLYTVFNTFFLLLIVKWKPSIQFSVNRLKPLIGYGWKLLATGLMFAGYSEFSKLIVGKRFSANDLGYYDKGTQFPHFIASNIDNTIIRVLFPTLSNEQDNLPKLFGMTRRAAKTSAFIMTPILTGLAVLATPIVDFLLTEKWLPCVPFIQIMCVSWWMQPIQSCSIQGIKAIGRSDIYLKIEIISKSIGILLLFGSLYFFNTVIAVACCMLIGQFVSLILYGWQASKYVNYKIKSQVMDLFSPLILSIVMAVCVLLTGKLFEGTSLCLLYQILIGCLTYFFLAYILKIEQFDYLINFIKKNKTWN